jgi:hypothetical protein
LKQAEFGRQRRYIPPPRIRAENLDFSQFWAEAVLSKITYTDDPPFDNRGAGWASDTRLKGEVERASLIKEGKSLFPACNPYKFRYRPQHSSRNKISKPWAADMSYPNLRCHNKKGGVEGTTPDTAEKAKD